MIVLTRAQRVHLFLRLVASDLLLNYEEMQGVRDTLLFQQPSPFNTSLSVPYVRCFGCGTWHTTTTSTVPTVSSCCYCAGIEWDFRQYQRRQLSVQLNCLIWDKFEPIIRRQYIEALDEYLQRRNQSPSCGENGSLTCEQSLLLGSGLGTGMQTSGSPWTGEGNETNYMPEGTNFW